METPVLRSRAFARLPPRPNLRKIKRSDGVVVHCSDGRQPVDAEDSAQALRNMRAWHVRRKGWLDIGYAYAFDDHGNVFPIRGWGVQGAHSNANPDGKGSLNVRASGIVYLGDGKAPTAKAVAAGRWLIAEHDKRFGVGFVIGHRDVSGKGKECPGDGVMAELVTPYGRPLGGAPEQVEQTAVEPKPKKRRKSKKTDKTCDGDE